MYIHDLNPFALQITSTFGIRWYGLAYLAGFYFGYLLIRYLASRALALVKPEAAGDLVFALALGAVLGGRLGYCILYKPELFLQFTHNLPFWGVLAINEGGMASHGGIIGVMIAATYFGMRNKLPALHLIDLATLGGCIGIFFGRIANFINGELLGRVAETPIFFAVKFPQEILAWPSQAPGKLSALGAVVERLGVSSSTWQTWLSQPALYYTSIENTLYQIISRIQDGDAALKISLAPFLSARYPSQLYEAILEGLFVLVVLVWVWRKPQKPGVIAATFGITYSLVRIVGEAYRLPDAHIGYQMFGLTRGQILSAVMALGMTTLLLYALKKPGTKIGGWLNGRTKNIN